MISLNLISLNLTGHIFDTTRNKIYQKLVSYFQPLGAVSMVMTSTSCARRGEKPHRRWPENSTRYVAQTTWKSILPIAETTCNTLLGVPSDQSLFWVKAIIGDDKNAFLWLRVVKGQGTTDQWGCNCSPCLRLRSKRRIKWGNDFIYMHTCVSRL